MRTRGKKTKRGRHWPIYETRQAGILFLLGTTCLWVCGTRSKISFIRFEIKYGHGQKIKRKDNEKDDLRKQRKV